MGDEAERASAENEDFLQDIYAMDIMTGGDYKYGIYENGEAYKIMPYKLKFKDSTDIAYLYRDKISFPKTITAVCNTVSSYYKLKSLLRLFKFSNFSRVEINEKKGMINIELSSDTELKSFIKFIQTNNYIKNACKMRKVPVSDGTFDIQIKFKEVPLAKYKKRLRDFGFHYDSETKSWVGNRITQLNCEKVTNYLKKQSLL